MTVRNLAEMFEAEVGGDPIIAAVIGADYRAAAGSRIGDHYAKMLSWAEARPILDYAFNHDGDCHAVYAWTAYRVLFVAMTHDGSGLVSIDLGTNIM